MSKDVDCLNPKSVGEVFQGAAAGAQVPSAGLYGDSVSLRY